MNKNLQSSSVSSPVNDVTQESSNNSGRKIPDFPETLDPSPSVPRDIQVLESTSDDNQISPGSTGQNGDNAVSAPASKPYLINNIQARVGLLTRNLPECSQTISRNQDRIRMRR
jgi:hypothetical protein